MKKLLILFFLAFLGTGWSQTPPLYSVNAKYVGFGGTGGGTGNAQTVTFSPALTSYSTGQMICWFPAAANTGAATLNAGTPGAKSLVKQSGAALAANDLLTTAEACALYDGTAFELQNPQTIGSTVGAVTSVGLAGTTNHITVTGTSPITSSGSWTLDLGTSIPVRSLGYAFGDLSTGSALTTSEVGYITVPFACTITGWHIMLDAGTATIKTARVNGGTALPTIGSNSISTSGVSLSTGTKVDSSTVSDFTSTAIAANDTLGFFITAVATAKQITFQLDCTQ